MVRGGSVAIGRRNTWAVKGGGADSTNKPRLRQRQPSYAVNRIGSSGRSSVLSVEADRFDHEVSLSVLLTLPATQ